MSDGSLRVDLAVHTKGDRHARVAMPMARPTVPESKEYLGSCARRLARC
jgi:hypothetical protein